MARTIEGDWEYTSDKGYDPVKISIKNFKDSNWLVACMIPKGNMMASTLNKVDAESYDLLEFRCSNKKETPEENKVLEEEFKEFLGKGISRISRQDDTLVITAGNETKTVTLDLMLKRQEDAKRAAMTAANKNPRRR